MALMDLRPQATRRSPEALAEHLAKFRLAPRFSAGVWFFSPAGSRFHAPYGPSLPLEARLEVAASLGKHGLAALEAHYPNEINEENAPVWRAFVRQTGIRLLTVIPLLFWDAQFEFGSLSSPLPGPRKAAIERAKGALRMNREFDTDFAVVWPGIDGYEHGFGMDFASARDRFADGLAEVMDEVPGVRIAFEPKPYEPRGRILYGTTPEGVLLGRQVEAKLRHPENRRLLGEGHALVCMNPEVGHVLMGFEDLAYAFSWPLSEGRLAHSHWNSQPLGNYDQDLCVGVVSPELLEGLVYTLAVHGYEGYYGIDINPERMPVEIGLRNSFDAIRAAVDRVQSLDHASIQFAHTNPDKARGWLEGYLVRARAARPGVLSPWPAAREWGR